MGIVDYDILSWDNLLNWQLMLVLLFALVFMLAVALRPRFLWPLLVFSTIAGNLPKIGGYILADEILMGAIFIGGVMALAVLKGTVERERNNSIDLRQILFLLWMGYLIIQAFRGMVVTDDSRVVRWIFLYGLLAVGVFLVSNRAFRPSSGRRLLVGALVSTLVVFGVYVGQGVYYEDITGIGGYGRFLTQERFVAGSATAVFPVVLAIPAALFLMKDRSRRVRLLVWLTIVMIMSVAYYFDSRVTSLVLLAFLGVSVFRVGIARATVIAVVFLIIAFVFLPQPKQNLPGYIANLYAATKQLWSPSDPDVGRNLDLRAGIMTATEKWDTFLFGYGINSHKYVVLHNERYLRSLYLPPDIYHAPGSRSVDDPNAKVFRTTGFSALLLDTGLIGTLLLVANLLLVAHMVWVSGSPHRPVLMLIPCILFGWLLINNILDVVLWYLLMMPGGLTEIFSRYRPAVQARRQEVPVTRQVTPTPMTTDLSSRPASP